MGVIRHFTGTQGRPDWAGVAVSRYDDAETGGATRRQLIGADEGAANFAVRYFEIPPEGVSSLDRHDHDHGVYVVTGQADLLLGDATHRVGPGDVIYISPGETHQFRTVTSGPFGFLCIVPPR